MSFDNGDFPAGYVPPRTALATGRNPAAGNFYTRPGDPQVPSPTPNMPLDGRPPDRPSEHAGGNPRGTPTIEAWDRPVFGSENYGSLMRSYILRDQYRDYQTRFEPIERELIDETLSTKLLDERLGQISVNTDRAFDNAESNAAIRRRRYGVSMDADEQASFSRQANYGRAMSTANARNNARTHEYDRRLETIFGSSSGPRETLSEV